VTIIKINKTYLEGGFMVKYLTALIIVLFGSGYAGVLITNGDFEEPLTTGWHQAAGGSYCYVDRATNYDPDADYEASARVDSLSGGGVAVLYQEVAIPTTDLEFSVNAKLFAWDNNADTLCCAGAAVIITYIDGSGTSLGETKICRFTDPFNWSNSSTCHLIISPDTNWHNYSFNINDELTNLPGVNPADIKKIKVSLYAKTDHTC